MSGVSRSSKSKKAMWTGWIRINFPEECCGSVLSHHFNVSLLQNPCDIYIYFVEPLATVQYVHNMGVVCDFAYFRLGKEVFIFKIYLLKLIGSGPMTKSVDVFFCHFFSLLYRDKTSFMMK